VVDRSSEERRRIIEKWNRKFEKQKEEEKRKIEAAEAKMNFLLLQQKLQANLGKLQAEKQKENENKTENLESSINDNYENLIQSNILKLEDNKEKTD